MKVLIIARTYPCISKKYKETVCTVGITENRKLLRMYPITFYEAKKYKYNKFQWINVDVKKDISDPRKESYKIAGKIQEVYSINLINNWKERKRLILKNVIFTKEKLLRLTRSNRSLAVFKPNKIQKLIIRKFKDNDKIITKFYYEFTDIKNKISILQILDYQLHEFYETLSKKHNFDYARPLHKALNF